MSTAPPERVKSSPLLACGEPSANACVSLPAQSLFTRSDIISRRQTSSLTMAAATTTSSSALPLQSYSARPAAPLKSKTPHRIDLTNLTSNNVGQFRKLNSVLFPVRYSESFYKQALQEEKKAVCKLGESSRRPAQCGEREGSHAGSHRPARPPRPALFNDIPVGNLCCRYEYKWSSSSSSLPPVNVYIMTLGVLAPYRRLGIGRALIDHLFSVVSPGTELDLPDPNEPSPSVSQQVAEKVEKNQGQPAAVAKAARTKKKFRVESIFLHVQTSNDEAREFYKAQGFAEEEIISEYYRQGVEPRSAVLLAKRG